MANKKLIEETKKGQIITAKKMSTIARAINANTDAIKRPTQKDIPAGGGSTSGELTDEVFESTSITEETVTATDSNGDTVDLERTTQIVLAETTTGRTITLNINWP